MPDPRRQALQIRFGAQLRLLRRRAGLSHEQLAGRVPYTQSKISRIEGGKLWPPMPDIMAWLEACGVEDEERDRTIALAEAIDLGITTLRELQRGDLEIRQREVLEMDAQTTEVRVFAPLVIPGVFHNEAYARACISAVNLRGTPGLDAAVAARLERGDRMRKTGKPQMHAIITEAALRWEPVDAEGARLATLANIVESAAAPNITVQVIPTGTPMTVMPTSSFWQWTFRDESPMVMCELVAADVYFSGDVETADFDTVWARLERTALSKRASQAFLRQLVKEAQAA